MMWLEERLCCAASVQDSRLNCMPRLSRSNAEQAASKPQRDRTAEVRTYAGDTAMESLPYVLRVHTGAWHLIIGNPMVDTLAYQTRHTRRSPGSILCNEHDKASLSASKIRGMDLHMVQ